MRMDRRHFLKHGSQAGAALMVANQLWDVRQAFSDSLASLRDFAELRKHYLLQPDLVYLNHAAIGTIPRAVHRARQKYLDLCESNPWLYIWGGIWNEAREETRELAAEQVRCSPGEMALTHNTTEGFNLLAGGLPLGSGDEVVFSSLNHAGASVCWHHQAQARGFKVKQFDFPVLDAPKLSASDVIDIYSREISSRTRVLVFPHIDNIIGLRYPVKELTAVARSRGVEYVAVDGAQSAGMIDIDVVDLNVDFYAGSPHKWVQAPKGLGFLYVKNDLREVVSPMWVTWGQARWRDSAKKFEDYGTRNVPEVLALGDALRFQAELNQRDKIGHYRSLWQRFRDRVAAAKTLTWRSPTNWDLSSSVYAVEVAGVKSGELAQDLFENHHTVVRPFSTQGLNSIRISPNCLNTVEEVDRTCDLLSSLAQS